MSESKGAEKSIRAAIKKAGKPSELQELDLSEIQINKITPEIKDLIEKCSQLRSLKLAECSLSTLDNFPKLPNLQELDVSTNAITDKDLKIIGSNCQKLISLSIGDNQISAIASLKSLKSLTGLKSLWSEDNPIASDPTYLKVAFGTFKELQSLDGKDQEGKQIQEEFQENSEENQSEESRQGGSDEEQSEGQEDDGNGEKEEEQQDEQQEVKPKKKKR